MGIRDDLKSGRVLVADGAAGTLLQAAGLPAGTLPEEWNVSRPDEIEAMHRAYVAAGAHIILTNSFGANPIKLRRAGRENDMARFNRAAVEIARRSAGVGVFVGGDVGPTGELLQPMGGLAPAEARQAYARQAAELADAGVDLIVIETMSDLGEARAAIEGIHDACDLPVVCSMSFDSHLHTMMGVSPERMMETLWPLDLLAIGANCGKSLDDNLQVLARLRKANPDATLWIKANAGLPRLEGDCTNYDVQPEEFAGYALKFASVGASVIGGCCGTTPAHIAAVATLLA